MFNNSFAYFYRDPRRSQDLNGEDLFHIMSRATLEKIVPKELKNGRNRVNQRSPSFFNTTRSLNRQSGSIQTHHFRTEPVQELPLLMPKLAVRNTSFIAPKLKRRGRQKQPQRLSSKVCSVRPTPAISINIEPRSGQWITLRKHLVTLMGQEIESHYFKITREVLRKHMTQFFPGQMVTKFLNFVEFPLFVEFEGYVSICDRFNRWTREDFFALFYHLIDFDCDGMISASDLFKLYKLSNLEEDFSLLQKRLLSLKVSEEPVFPEIFTLKTISIQQILNATDRNEGSPTVSGTTKKITVYHQGYFSTEHSFEQREIKPKVSSRNPSSNRTKRITKNDDFFSIVNEANIRMNFVSVIGVFPPRVLPQLIKQLIEVFTLCKI